MEMLACKSEKFFNFSRVRICTQDRKCRIWDMRENDRLDQGRNWDKSNVNFSITDLSQSKTRKLSRSGYYQQRIIALHPSLVNLRMPQNALLVPLKSKPIRVNIFSSVISDQSQDWDKSNVDFSISHLSQRKTGKLSAILTCFPC